jgi:hypothetical protein
MACLFVGEARREGLKVAMRVGGRRRVRVRVRVVAVIPMLLAVRAPPSPDCQSMCERQWLERSCRPMPGLAVGV